MNPAEDAELLAKELLVEALRALSGNWSLVLTPAVAAAVIPLVQGSMALARLGMTEGIPSSSFRAELRVARAVVNSSGVFLPPESVSAVRTSDEPSFATQEPLRASQGVSALRSGLDSPDRGVIAGGHRVTIDNSRVEN